MGADQSGKIRLTFLIRSLDVGGAQRQLITLAKALDKTQFEVSILTFYSGQLLEGELTGTAVRVVSLNKRGRWDLFSFLRRLIREVRLLQPDIVHGYLDIPNVLALLVKCFVSTKVVWGVRASQMELHDYDWLFRLAARIEKILSSYPDLIIVNSEAAYQHHRENDFPAARLKLIPNGIDTDFFKPDLEGRVRLRREWGVPEDVQLVGAVGRLDPVKGLPIFLGGASEANREMSSVHFVCVGDGPAKEIQLLEELSLNMKIADKFFLVRARSDMPAVYSALDLLVSSSRAESFPNSVAEAMSCGVPCIVTNVGDAAAIVGDCGVVLEWGHPDILGPTIVAALAQDKAALGARCRARIVEHFGVEQLARRTEEALKALVARASRP
jgi:glycosyltransferase involved in cell wall biosynthesis